MGWQIVLLIVDGFMFLGLLKWPCKGVTGFYTETLGGNKLVTLLLFTFGK